MMLIGANCFLTLQDNWSWLLLRAGGESRVGSLTLYPVPVLVTLHILKLVLLGPVAELASGSTRRPTSLALPVRGGAERSGSLRDEVEHKEEQEEMEEEVTWSAWGTEEPPGNPGSPGEYGDGRSRCEHT